MGDIISKSEKNRDRFVFCRYHSHNDKCVESYWTIKRALGADIVNLIEAINEDDELRKLLTKHDIQLVSKYRGVA